MAKAVLVVDMLRCFLERGHPLYLGGRARRIAPLRVAPPGRGLLFIKVEYVRIAQYGIEF